jgi:hypothetical protein
MFVLQYLPKISLEDDGVPLPLPSGRAAAAEQGRAGRWRKSEKGRAGRRASQRHRAEQVDGAGRRHQGRRRRAPGMAAACEVARQGCFGDCIVTLMGWAICFVLGPSNNKKAALDVATIAGLISQVRRRVMQTLLQVEFNSHAHLTG